MPVLSDMHGLWLADRPFSLPFSSILAAHRTLDHLGWHSFMLYNVWKKMGIRICGWLTLFTLQFRLLSYTLVAHQVELSLALESGS
jgi:hypothetical protein